MKKIISIVFCLSLLFFSTNSIAQINLKGKAEKLIKKQLNKKESKTDTTELNSGNSQNQQNKIETPEKKSETAQSFDDQYQEPYSSNFHQNNVGKLIFSNDIISRDNPSVMLKTEFNVTDFIYGRWFSDKSAQNTNLILSDGTIERSTLCRSFYKVYVDGIDQGLKLQQAHLDNKFATETTRQIWLHPKPTDDPTEIEWVNLVNQLSNGKHNIKMEYYVQNVTGESVSNVIASGEFTLIKKVGDVLKIGKNWNSISAKMKDATLEKRALELCQIKLPYKAERGDQFLAAKIIQSNWKVVYNKVSGVPIYRWLPIQILSKKSNGACFLLAYGVQQDYLGNNQYSDKTETINFVNIPGEIGYLDCN